jgi:hypothetical protein
MMLPTTFNQPDKPRKDILEQVQEFLNEPEPTEPALQEFPYRAINLRINGDDPGDQLCLTLGNNLVFLGAIPVLDGLSDEALETELANFSEQAKAAVIDCFRRLYRLRQYYGGQHSD